MTELRVIHYVNQFFAGIGGEEHANQPPRLIDGPLGPGKGLESALGGRGHVVATLFCGDNFAVERPVEFVEQALALAEPFMPADVLVAGPAFSSGRYGLACGAIAQAFQDKFSVPAVVGLASDNPAVEEYRGRVLLAVTGAAASSMREALGSMSSLAMKLGRREPLGSAAAEGYVPTGRKRNEWDSRTGAERAVDMLLARLAGRPFNSELWIPRNEPVAPAAALASTGQAKIALVTEAGLVPKGNPDRLEGMRPSKWVSYSLKGMERLQPGAWETVHGGFHPGPGTADPNRLLPLDACRELEREGRIAKLHERYYGTTGNIATLDFARSSAAAIARELHASGVEGIILTAT